MRYKRMIFGLAFSTACSWVVLVVVNGRIAAVATVVLSVALLLAVAVAHLESFVRPRSTAGPTISPLSSARANWASRRPKNRGGASADGFPPDHPEASYFKALGDISQEVLGGNDPEDDSRGGARRVQ